jgi:hypothetical protein
MLKAKMLLFLNMEYSCTHSTHSQPLFYYQSSGFSSVRVKVFSFRLCTNLLTYNFIRFTRIISFRIIPEILNYFRNSAINIFRYVVESHVLT